MSYPHFSTQVQWHSSLTHSFPSFESYPKSLLSEDEQEFILWLQSFQLGDVLHLHTAQRIGEKIKELWGWLVGGLAVDSIAKNLYSGRSYANKEYRIGKRKVGLWLFRKGLLRKYPVPVTRAKLRYLYGYPTEHYQLIKRNYEAQYPPHDYFSSMCFSQLREGVRHGILTHMPSDKQVVRHWDDDGEYVADNCYRLEIFGKKWYLWLEVHTGSEGYDERVFLRRLLTMEQFLQDRPNDQFIVFVPFIRDIVTAERSITKYNHQVLQGSLVSPAIILERSALYSYTQIANLKESLGFYRHRHWR